MIIRTITDEATGAVKSVRFLGISLKSVTGLLQNIKSNGLANALFYTPTIDTGAIERYNDDVSTGISAEKALANAKNNTNKATIALIESAKGEIVELEALTAAQKASTLAARASQAVTKGLAMAFSTLANIGLSIAISKIISLFYDMFTAHDRLLDKAKELGEAFSQEKESIEDYKEKINELQSVITDHSSSFDDVSQARKNLMDVQDELIKKFGTEKDTIDIITDAINNQSDALDELTRRQYTQWENDFNHKTAGDNIVDFITGPNTNNAVDKLTQLDLPGAWQALIQPGQSKISKMKESMQQASYSFDKTGNDALDAFLAKTYGLTVNSSGTSFVIRGYLDDVHEKLLEIQEITADFKPSKSFESSLADAEIRMRKTLDSYEESYNTFMLYDRILASSEDNLYNEQFAFLNSAKEAYDNALLSGNTEQIAKASEEYVKTLQSAVNLAMDNSDVDVAYFFKSMHPSLQEMFGEWQFTINFEPNTDGLKDSVINALDSIDGISDETISFSTEALENFNPVIASQDQLDAYGELIRTADSYGLTLKQLISLLQTMGVIQSERHQELVNTFGQENITTLSPGDLEIAYQIKNTGNMTFEALQEEIRKVKKAAAEKFPLSVSQTIDQLNTRLKPALDSLGSAYRRLFSDGVFNPDAVDLSMLGNIKSSIEELNSLQDVDINIDMAAFDSLASTLTAADVTQQQAQQAFDDFATSVFYATAATEGMTDETEELVEQMLESLGVANAAEVAEYALAEAKAQNVLASHDLAMASADEVSVKEEEFRAILAEGVAAGLTRQQIYRLTAAEIAYAQNGLSTEGRIEQLRNLAAAYGDTANAALATAIANDLASGHADADAALSELMEQINEGMGKVAIDFSGLEHSAAKAGKEAGKSYADALKDELSELNSVIGYVGSILDDQIDRFNDQKDAAVEALEAEKEAAEEALEAEKALIQEQIDAKQAEIDAIEEAAKARKNELSLQQKQYDLERLRNQKTILQYSEGKGMHYVTDTKAVREAGEAVAEASENLRIAGIEKEISGLNDTLDILDKKIEESSRYYDSLIEETEKYWDSLIRSLEEYKSLWQELSGIEEQAKMEAALRNLGISADDILNLSGSAFQSFKDNYLNTLREIYSGNDDILNILQEIGGISADTLRPLAGDINGIADSIRNVSDSISGSTGRSAGGTGYSVSHTGQSAGSNGQSAGDATLTDSIKTLGETADETLGEPDGDGVTGKFSELGQTVAETESHVAGVHEQMEDLDGATATCTITVNIETNGALPEYASGTGIEDAVSSLGASVGSHTAAKGSTSAGSSAAKGKGTANTSAKVTGAARVTGDWCVREAGRTLVGELGRELWVHVKDGTFETVGDNGPEFIRTEKGDLIFDHLRTGELLSKGRITEYRTQAAESLPGDRIAREYGESAALTPDGTVLLPYDPHRDPTPFGEIYRKWHAHMAKLDDREREDFLKIDTASEKNRQMSDAIRQISNTSIVTQNNRPSINVGDINITCPGVTSQAVMREVRTALTREFSGFRNYTDQWIRR